MGRDSTESSAPQQSFFSPSALTFFQRFSKAKLQADSGRWPVRAAGIPRTGRERRYGTSTGRRRAVVTPHRNSARGGQPSSRCENPAPSSRAAIRERTFHHACRMDGVPHTAAVWDACRARLVRLRCWCSHRRVAEVMLPRSGRPVRRPLAVPRDAGCGAPAPDHLVDAQFPHPE